MASKQSQKGARFEYLVRDKLKERTGVDWARAPMSGSGAIKGDLFAPKNQYHYCFECKSYKESVVKENILTAKSNNFYSWWEQAVQQADHMGKKPALIFKRDRGKAMIAVQEEIDSLPGFHLKTEWADCFVYVFDTWLDHIDLEELVVV